MDNPPDSGFSDTGLLTPALPFQVSFASKARCGFYNAEENKEIKLPNPYVCVWHLWDRLDMFQQQQIHQTGKTEEKYFDIPEDFPT